MSIKLIKTWNWLPTIAILSAAIGCSSGFNGSSDDSPFVGSGTGEVECFQGIGQIKLLSNSLNGLPSVVTPNAFRPQQSLFYSIGLKCQGKATPLNNVPISFDINATVTPFSSPVSYRILDPVTKQVLIDSQMESFNGRDLFDNVDTETQRFAFWETQPIQIATERLELVLEVILTDRDVGFSQQPSVGGSGHIDTYCRVGQTDAITLPVRLAN